MSDEPQFDAEALSAASRSRKTEVRPGTKAVDRAIEASRKQKPSVLSLDLARLSVVGWLVAAVTLTVAIGAAAVVAHQLSSAGFRAKLVALICVPIAIGIAAVLLSIARWLLSFTGSSLLRPEEAAAEELPQAD